MTSDLRLILLDAPPAEALSWRFSAAGFEPYERIERGTRWRREL